jgi:hypothetical protein
MRLKGQGGHRELSELLLVLVDGITSSCSRRAPAPPAFGRRRNTNVDRVLVLDAVDAIKLECIGLRLR